MNGTLRRNLHFQSLDDAVAECRALANEGYVRNGRWSLAQICRHLTLAQNANMTGYPAWTSLLAPLRPLLRRVILPRLLRGDSPAGVPALAIFMPPDGLENDAREVQSFADSVAALRSFPGRFPAHPVFGRLDRATLERLHASHAAHHLGFLTRKASVSPIRHDR